MSAILVATSIAPNSRIAEQQQAVQSWLRSGFEVHSLNSHAEIATLAPLFPEVAFQPVLRTGKLLTGRDHVFIDDILGHLATSGRTTVGIVNSDIVFDPIPNLSGRIADLAADALVCCPRLDIAQADAPNGTADPFGYDAFFFRSADTRLWAAPTRFCLGQGYWDHYLPLMAILRSHPACKILPPIGRHITHATQRDDSFFLFADEFAALASGFMSDAAAAAIDWRTFGQSFPKHVYAETRAKVESGRQEDIEAYAHHIDALTRYVIAFIDANCRKVALGD